MTTIQPNAGNRPGLPRLDYRAGTHGTFKAAMLARLSSDDLPPLAQLTTRSDDDFTISLLDAWAVAADVVTFYTERIANESYLGTATERRSLTALGGLVGYLPHPGVAAEVHLAFTLEEAGGAGDIIVPAGLQVASIPGPGELPQTFETTEPLVGRPEWNALRPVMTTQDRLSLGSARPRLHLRGTSTNLNPGDMVVLEVRGEKTERIARQVLVVQADPASNTTAVELEAGRPVTQQGAGSTAKGRITAAFALRQRAALFGHNAPKYEGLPANHTILRDGSWAPINPAPFPKNWDAQTLDKEPGGIRNGTSVDLDRVYPQVIPGGWLVLSTLGGASVYRVVSHVEVSRADYTLSGRISRVKLDSAERFGQCGLRGTAAYVQSEELLLADTPRTDAVSGSSVLVDGAHPKLTAGRVVAVSGTLVGSDTVASEVVTLQKARCDKGTTELTFVTALANTYQRGTVTINANVVHATHGQTSVQDLGVGDATVPFQSFTLPGAPLTYVAADNPLGAASSLEVYVNGQRWAEVPWLHGHGPDEHVYVTRVDDAGRATLTFGDGTTGARLPSGVPGNSNVKAEYRTGVGPEGLVAEGQLSLLRARPLGVRSVTNPLPSGGAAARDSSADVRRNAPLPMRSLGRIVSLRDYEDFARAFAGVAKALATWAWSGHGRVVLLTVAGADGAAIKPGEATYTNLLAAIRAAGDPAVPLRVENYRPAYFRVAGTLTVDPAYQADAVAAAVEGELRARFSFENRAFAQPVALSEVYAAVHAVSGVRAMHIEELRRTDAGISAIRPIRVEALPEVEVNTSVASQLQLDAPVRVTASGMPARPIRVGKHLGVEAIRAARRVGDVLPSEAPSSVPGTTARAAELLLLDPGPIQLTIRKG